MKPEKRSSNKETHSNKSSLQENIEAIFVAIILALFIRTFIIQAFKIPSGSMLPTLQIGDHILVNKFIYGIKLPILRTTIIPLKNPVQGDIIVFRYPHDPSKDYIKRVVGTEGDVVESHNKKIYINHAPLENQTYAVYTDPNIYPAEANPRDNFGPITVPKNSLFVMGDNRDNSADSRFWGFVKLKEVKGKAFIIYWSSIIPWEWDWPWNWDWGSFVIRWDRIGKLIK